VVMTAAVAVVMVCMALPAIGGPYYFQDKQWFTVSRFRGLHDLIGDRVVAGHKLLIVPSTAYHNGGYQTDLYFGSNAQFLIDQPRNAPYTPELLARIAHDGSFSYVYYTSFVDLRTDEGSPLSGVDGVTWRQQPGESPYSVDRETVVIGDFTIKYYAHLFAESEWGKIYSLRKRRIFPNSDFVLGTLDGWRPEGAAALFAPRRNLGVLEGMKLFPMEQGPASGGSMFHLDTRAPDAGEDATGLLVSEPFKVEEGIIGFLLAGAVDPEKIHVALRVAGTEFRAAPVGNRLSAGQWDVAKYRGQQAQIIIRDLDPAVNRGIRVDAFYYVM